MSVNSIRNLLELAAKYEPHKIALIHTSESLSYEVLKTKVDQIAHYLTTLGLKKGSRVGIYSNKSTSQVIAYTGTSLNRVCFCTYYKAFKA